MSMATMTQSILPPMIDNHHYQPPTTIDHHHHYPLGHVSLVMYKAEGQEETDEDMNMRKQGGTEVRRIFPPPFWAVSINAGTKGVLHISFTVFTN